MDKIQAIRGMNDLQPSQAAVWQQVEAAIREVVESYSYSEIRFPILESTQLFKRSIGEVTDIVEKEMYTFDDRNGDSVTMRPEGTASCVRAGIEQGLLYNQQQKLWYQGPMFRYEKPQKGRLRQFHQFGVECFGIAGPAIEAEHLLITARIWQYLGVDQYLKLHLNNIGEAAERAAYKAALVEYLEGFKAELDEDSQRRLTTNPLRILDSKAERTQQLLADAPRLSAFLGDATQAHLNRLCTALDQAGVAYTLDERLVRGLDYYNQTVFEWVTDELGAQGTVCGGGRYDGLVQQLGGHATQGVGFAIGLERLCLLIEEKGKNHAIKPVDAFVIAPGDNSLAAISMVEALRSELPQSKIHLQADGASFKSQMKKADKSGAQWALIVGDDEAASRQFAVKNLRDRQVEQKHLPLSEVIQLLRQHV